MRTILLGLIRLYAWVMGPLDRRRERKRIDAKLAKLRQHDHFNYPIH